MNSKKQEELKPDHMKEMKQKTGCGEGGVGGYHTPPPLHFFPTLSFSHKPLLPPLTLP